MPSNRRRIARGSLVLTLGLLLCSRSWAALKPSTTDRPAQPPSIASIRELAELAVLEIDVTDIVTGQAAGYTGSTTTTLLIAGTATLAIDMTDACFIQVDPQRRHAVLSLPPPTLQRIAIDPATTRPITTQRHGLWHLAPGHASEDEAVLEAMQQHRQRLEAAGLPAAAIKRAKEQTESIVARYSNDLGWTLMIDWQQRQ